MVVLSKLGQLEPFSILYQGSALGVPGIHSFFSFEARIFTVLFIAHWEGDTTLRL